MVSDSASAHPRALVLDLLGDLVRVGAREIRLKALVSLGELLGISVPTMRATLARFRENGWFNVTKQGRESVYQFSPELLVQIHEGAQRLHRPAPDGWNGEWSMVIYTVPEANRQTREELRKHLVWFGFGALAPATWISPHPILDDIAAVAARLPNAHLDLLTTRTTGVIADRALVERCWDLRDLGVEYVGFVRDLRLRTQEFQSAALDPKAAFNRRIHLVHDYRHCARHDPQLPTVLQPTDWQGDTARELFEQLHALLSESSREHYDEYITNY